MTLLVRDEADIVGQNIEFHLEHGVDFIIATDNGSVDGTREILAEYERLGVVTVLDEPGRDYSQWKWVTRMALMARDEFDADWIMNNDADEFWLNSDGQLKESLNAPNAQVLSCKRLNLFNSHDAIDEARWPDSFIHRVTSPTPVPILEDFYEDELPCPYFYLDLPPKALVSAPGLEVINQGNHSAEYEGETIIVTSDIVIYHFPFRSLEQFRRKILQGGEAYNRNTDLPANAGWHWRRWYRMMLSDDVKSVYAEALPSTERLRLDIETGSVIEDTSLIEALRSDRKPAESVKA